MELNYTLTQQDLFEFYSHKLEPEKNKMILKSLLCAFSSFLVLVVIESANGLNWGKIGISALFGIAIFFGTHWAFKNRFKQGALKYISSISNESIFKPKKLILNEDYIELIGDADIKSNYDAIHMIELTSNLLYIQLNSGLTIMVPIRLIENVKWKVFEVLCTKSTNAVRIGL